MPQPATKITIVSACRNEIHHIAGFLDSILAQEMDGLDWEAIIADGMSGDGTKQRVEQYAAKHPRLRAIDNPGRIVSMQTAVRTFEPTSGKGPTITLAAASDVLWRDRQLRSDGQRLAGGLARRRSAHVNTGDSARDRERLAGFDFGAGPDRQCKNGGGL